MTALRSPVNWIHVLSKKDAAEGEKDTKIIALRSKNGTYLLSTEKAVPGAGWTPL